MSATSKQPLLPAKGGNSSGFNSGVAAGLGAHLFWGVSVLFWPLLKDLPAVSIMAHRMIWSCVFIFIILTLTRRWDEVRAAVRNKRIFLVLAANAAILSFNWSLFLWAVNSGRTVECSLGYYITPLLNVIMGRILLGEKMSKAQALAILLALSGVVWGIVGFGHVPWVGLALAFSFAVYGYLQKTIRVEAAPSLFVETAVLFPFALAWLAIAHPGSLGLVGYGTARPFMLMSTVFFTGLPLLLFSFAARHISLSTIGILQYVSPSINFILAVLVNGDQIKSSDMVTFPLVWCALIIYTWDALRGMRRMRQDAVRLAEEAEKKPKAEADSGEERT